MYQSTQRNHASFKAVQNPPTKAVVSTGLAVVFVPLAAFAAVAYPAMSVSTVVMAVLTYGVVTADATRQYLNSLRAELSHRAGQVDKSADVDDSDSTFYEETV